MILSHADVLNAVAVVIDEQLCVYYTATKEIDSQELSDFAAESLAYYMVPDILIQLEEMPDGKSEDRQKITAKTSVETGRL